MYHKAYGAYRMYVRQRNIHFEHGRKTAGGDRLNCIGMECAVRKWFVWLGSIGLSIVDDKKEKKMDGAGIDDMELD